MSRERAAITLDRRDLEWHASWLNLREALAPYRSLAIPGSYSIE